MVSGVLRRWLPMSVVGLACCAAPAAPTHPAPAHERPAVVAKAPQAAASPEPAVPLEACERLESRAPVHEKDLLDAPVPAIERAETLAPLYEALAALERKRKKEPVRIGIWGDSNLTLDEVSGIFRRSLQRRFGDAGHGYIGIGNPFRGYRHMDVGRTMIGYWQTYIFTRGDKPKRGGFGAGGMAAATGERRARVRIETAGAGAPVGTHAGRLSVFYLRQPDGGSFSIDVDGKEQARVATAGEPLAVLEHRVSVPDGPHRFEITSLEPKRWVQLYGATLERDAPGVVVDAFGVTGATFGTLAALSPESVRPMLEARRHDLVVFALGTNFWNSDENPEGLRKLIELHRSIDPKRPILVLTPPDHVQTEHHTHSDPRVVRVTEQLRAAAAAHEVGLWDFREAMGGDGSMWLFVQRGLAGKDLYHLTSTGARLMGNRFAHALLSAYHGHLAGHPTAGCGEFRQASARR
jgi:lysophospholipase L1-like esterase